MSERKIGKYKIEISHPDKILFPEAGITKADLADFYEKISGYILPHLKNRPLSMHRYPDGIKKKGFFQKEASDFFPDWVKTEKVKKKEGGNTDAPVCNNKATLVYLTNLANITPHIWLSKIDNIHKPDKIIFDLDPPKDDFDIVRSGAEIIKRFFEDELNFTPFIMTTGSSGLHVVIPIKADSKFDDVRNAAQKISEILANKNSDKLTSSVRKNKRKGRLFLDVARNAYGQTAVAPYSVRAREGAPVATPVDWKELGKKGINSQSYNVGNIFRRLSNKENPWKDFNKRKLTLKKITEMLENYD